MNVQTLPESPTQDGNDTILSFFVNLPGGTMPLETLTIIFVSSPTIITQRHSAYVTQDIKDNAVSILLRNYQADEVISKTLRMMNSIRLELTVYVINPVIAKTVI